LTGSPFDRFGTHRYDPAVHGMNDRINLTSITWQAPSPRDRRHRIAP
jgi:hypothetical protein